MLAKIYQVDTIDLKILKSKPPILSIVATGTVGSTGWKNGRLVPYIYVKPPDNGIYEFDFVAETPSDMVLDVLMPIYASGEWRDFPADLKGIKVNASSNSETQELSAAKEVESSKGGGSGNPKGMFVG